MTENKARFGFQNKGIKEEASLNEQQSWTVPKIIYAALMSFLLLGYMIIIATYKDATTTGQTYQMPIYFWVLRVITAVMAIFLGRLWKDKGFLILMAYLLLKAVRVAADNPVHLFDQGVSESLLTGLWVFSACYGLARIIEKDQLKKYLSINAAIWTAGMVIYSCIGIYAAWTGKYIYNIGHGSYWGLYDHRLTLVYYTTVSASVLSISAIICFSGFIISKRISYKVFFSLSLMLIFTALCLTDTRASQVSAATGIAVAMGIIVIRIINSKRVKTDKRYWIAWILGILSTAITFVLVVYICSRTINIFNHFRANGIIVSKAFAEDTVSLGISNRGFAGADPFTSRRAIWHWTLYTLQTNPMLLLFGASIYRPMALVNHYLWYIAPHCHNMPLMIILENGIPGFILIASFFSIVIFRSVRLSFEKEINWEYVLIPVVLSVAIAELVECFTWLRSGQSPVLPFFFVAIGTIMMTGEKKKTLKVI